MRATRRRRRRQRQQVALVLQQHHRPGRGAPDELAGARVVGRVLVGAGRRGAGPLAEREQPGHGRVQLALGQLAGVDGTAQVGAALARRAGHLQVEPGAQRGDRAVGPEPVADDGAVEAPLAAQHLGDQPRVLAAVRPVEPVVGGHDRAHAGVLDGPLERHEVQLAQRALVDLGRDRHPLELGVVADEVLDAARPRPRAARRRCRRRRSPPSAPDPRCSTRSCGRRSVSGGG